MFDDARFVASHSIPISTNFKIAKHFSVTASANYEDVWTLETFNQRFDPNEGANGAVVRDTISGFDRYNQYSLNLGIGTTLYGTFNFGENKKIQAIRHVMRPSISYGYAPSFEQFYDEFLNETTGETVQFSRFDGTLNGAPRLGKSNALNFSLANTLEAKVKDKDSTATEPKKIPILSNFNIATGYNFEAEEFKLSPFNISGNTSILDQKMAINFGASLDPYALDNNNQRINTFNIKNGGSLFRLTSARLNISYSLKSDIFSKDKEEEEEENTGPDYRAASGGRADDLFGRSDDFNDISAFENENMDDIDNPLYGTKIPWDLRLAYSATYSNSSRQNEITNNSLMFSGNIELSPRWRLRASSGYDFKNKGFSLTQFGFARNLKSFEMSFNWTPFGQFERWFFKINIRNSILKDLKWENRSQPPRR